LSVPIDLRFSNVGPPTPEPKRSIYSDLVNLPDPVYLGLTVRIFNYDAVILYMQVDGYATGWTFTTNNLGSLASGANLYQNLDNFGYRAKPAAALSQTITVRLRAYTDAGYTNLKWTFERVIDIVFIKSDDGSWTQDFLNNFDDGTVQGWAVANETGNDSGYPKVWVVSEYCLSTPNSLRMDQLRTSSAGNVRGRYYKSFTTPDRPNVYGIFDIRLWPQRTNAACYSVAVEYRKGSDILVHLGKELGNYTSGHKLPTQKWMRIVAPLPQNQTIEIQIAFESVYYATVNGYGCCHLDDFKIISKA